MTCPNCGKELPEGIVFCTFCGTKLVQNTAPTPSAENIGGVDSQSPLQTPVNTPAETPDSNAAPVSNAAPDSNEAPAANAAPDFNAAAAVNAAPYADAAGSAPVYTQFDVLKAKISSPLFLAICIVMTAVAAIPLISFSLDIYATLGSIACWIVYANAKSSTEPMKQSGYKFAAVTTRIIFVVNWILVGLLAIADLFIIALFSFGNQLFGDIDLSVDLQELLTSLDKLVPGLSSSVSLDEFTYLFAAWIFIIAAIVFAVITVALIVVNICYIRHIDKYTHSLSNAFVTGKLTVYNKSLATRFLVFGILGAVFSVSGIFTSLFIAPLSAVSAGCGIALPFMFYALINSAKPANK